MFDVRVAIQQFWGLVERGNFTRFFQSQRFSRDDVLRWKNHPVALKIHIAKKGAIFAGLRGAVEFRSASGVPGSGGLDVFCEQPAEAVTIEVQIVNDYVVDEEIDRIVLATRNIWPGVVMSYT